MTQPYYICGRGRSSLEQCFAAAATHPVTLPEDPDDFDAGERGDGLVTYQGKDGIWEAVLTLTQEQAAQLRHLPGIDEVTIFD